MTRFALAATALAISLLSAGCSSDDESPADSSGTSGGTSGAGGLCASETRKDTYSVGLEKVSPSGVRVRMLDAVPAPPAKGENAWTIQIIGADGKPIDDAKPTLSPFMPDHAHGTAVVPEITALGADGKYSVKRVYLPMAGYWTMTMQVGSEQIVFGFCIEG